MPRKKEQATSPSLSHSFQVSEEVARALEQERLGEAVRCHSQAPLRVVTEQHAMRWAEVFGPEEAQHAQKLFWRRRMQFFPRASAEILVYQVTSTERRISLPHRPELSR